MNHPTANNLTALNARFAIPGCLQFIDSESGLPMADISTPLAKAQVAMQGAQVLTWQPNGMAPVLWLSRAAVFAQGKPVRGGIPVCWPWFGDRPGYGMHGFVRTRMWELRHTSLDAHGQVHLSLGLQDDAATRAAWDHAFDLELRVTISNTLTLQLTTHNTGTQIFTLTEALHTYFNVGDIRQTTVHGLDGTGYLDKVRAFAPAQQSGPVHFTGETDRVYIHTSADCVIDDAGQKRRITVAKSDSQATVVWNPWIDKEKTMGDMAPEDYQRMVCVETANTTPHLVELAPGAKHSLGTTLSVVLEP